MTSTTTDAEAELEQFRQQWRAEVAKNKRSDGTSGAGENDSKSQRLKDVGLRQPAAGPSTARRKDLIDYSDEVEPRLSRSARQRRIAQVGCRRSKL